MADGGSIDDWSIHDQASATRNPQSAIPIRNGEGPAEEGWAPLPAEPIMGRLDLHVEKDRAGAAPVVELTLTLLGRFAGLLAVLAADGERQRAQPLLRDFLGAVETIPVITLFEAHQRVVDLVQSLRLHLDESEFEILLDIGFSALDCIEHLVELAAPRPLFPNPAHLSLHLGLDFTSTRLKHLLQFGIAGLRHPLFRSRLLNVLHQAAPSSPSIKMALCAANKLPDL